MACYTSVLVNLTDDAINREARKRLGLAETGALAGASDAMERERAHAKRLRKMFPGRVVYEFGAGCIYDAMLGDVRIREASVFKDSVSGSEIKMPEQIGVRSRFWNRDKPGVRLMYDSAARQVDALDKKIAALRRQRQKIVESAYTASRFVTWEEASAVTMASRKMRRMDGAR